MFLYKKQGGLCALSGVELTKVAGHGVVQTNASLDRIKPGGPYVLSNVRLTCVLINNFRGNSTDFEFKWWCKQVVDNGGF